ncbi:ferredoxin reductase [Mycolicibacterium sp. CBMA 361]|uniref:ferredoxin reductase n=1 Tax=Mycolicibacterium sp. CBMA 361 TaxID=2606610 RepID=UPI0012DDAE9D|nr:ferredoxin reductase [Mycolicibacterium sp. CBMA 361]MUM32903.1 2Fe-2S iron-sulfur cluster binding domain-containing protein [Mycolicibacterium sp. CBMA 361]
MSVVHEFTTDLVVHRRETAADGVVALDLVDPAGGKLPTWEPGAHIDLLLDEGLVRQYSLCGDPSEAGTWRVGVLLDPNSRGGSEHVHKHLREGAPIRVRGPRNNFPLIDAPKYLFIAGGIGVTPMKAMAESAERAGAVEKHSAHWPEGSLHVERFAATAPSAETLAEALDTYQVVCQRSGVTVEVSDGVPMLDALEDAGIPIMSSCGEGVCGTCRSTVLEGTPDHRDSMLTDAERAAGNVILPCVSHSRTEKLVLDL